LKSATNKRLRRPDIDGAAEISHRAYESNSPQLRIGIAKTIVDHDYQKDAVEER
jgi:hypothetical protein